MRPVLYSRPLLTAELDAGYGIVRSIDGCRVDAGMLYGIIANIPTTQLDAELGTMTGLGPTVTLPKYKRLKPKDVPIIAVYAVIRSVIQQAKVLAESGNELVWETSRLQDKIDLLTRAYMAVLKDDE